MPPYAVSFGDWTTHQDPHTGVTSAPRFRVHDGDVHLFSAVILIPEVFQSSLVGVQVGSAVPASEEGRERLKTTMLRFGVRYIEERLASGAWPPPPETGRDLTLTFGEEELSLLRRMFRDKDCRHQMSIDGDLYCSAASPQDETRVGSSNLKTLAPTTKPICRACNLPDTDAVCSHLTHPQVYGVQLTSGFSDRKLAVAACNQGQPGIAAPNSCRPDGHQCWERLVVPDEVRLTLDDVARAVPDAFDSLGMAWRLAFGGNRRLVLTRTLAPVAELSQPCTGRAEFQSRVSALADLLKQLAVDDDLLQPDAHLDGSQTFDRIESVLTASLDPEAAGRVSGVVADLRAVNRVRVGLQHTDAADELPARLRALGIPYPPESWAMAWDVIRGRTAQALLGLRDLVMTLAP